MDGLTEYAEIIGRGFAEGTDRDNQKYVGVSDIVQDCQRCLGLKVIGQFSKPPLIYDGLAMAKIAGNALDQWLREIVQRSTKKHWHTGTERVMVYKKGEFEVWGTCDIWTLEHGGWVIDNKTMTKQSWQYYHSRPNPSHIDQVMLYAYGKNLQLVQLYEKQGTAPEDRRYIQNVGLAGWRRDSGTPAPKLWGAKFDYERVKSRLAWFERVKEEAEKGNVYSLPVGSGCLNWEMHR